MRVAELVVEKQSGAPLGVHLEDAGGWWLLQPRRVVVASVAASVDLDEGDEIVSVNGVDATSAGATADLIRAAGGAVQLRVVRKAAGQHASEPSHASSLPMRLVIGVALGVLLLCLVNLWSAHSARQAAQAHEHARSDMAQWRTIAKAEAQRVEADRRDQQSLAQRASELQRQIKLLRHANASASSRVSEALASLRAQQRNVTEQRRAWRQAQQKAHQQLKAAGKSKASLSEAIADERRRAKQTLQQLSEARAQAAASLRAERAVAHRIAQRVRERMNAAAAELEEMAKAGGHSELSKEVADLADLAALVGQRDAVGGGGEALLPPAGRDGRTSPTAGVHDALPSLRKVGKGSKRKGGGRWKEGTGLSAAQRALPLCQRGPTSFVVDYASAGDGGSSGGSSGGSGGPLALEPARPDVEMPSSSSSGGGGTGGGGGSRKRKRKQRNGRRLEVESSKLPPCCTDSNPEPYRMGRCAFFADRDKCAEGNSRQYCPVACEVCRICEGHPMLASYQKLFAKRKKPLSYDATATTPDTPFVAPPPPAAAPPPPSPRNVFSAGLDLFRDLVRRGASVPTDAARGDVNR